MLGLGCPQRSHVWSQADSQQTPSTQCPEMHSKPLAHVGPMFFFGTQTLLSHQWVPRQWALVEQAVRQTSPFPLQT